MDQELKKKLEKQSEEKIKEILEQGITVNNIEFLDKIVDIYKDTKEVENMNYGNYGNYGNYNGRNPGHGSYGEYGNYGNYGEYGRDSYGRRGYDAKYRGHDYIERMSGEYGRYEEGRQRYGANEDTKRSLKYMLESMEDFARMLKEEAQSQEEIEMIRQTAQRIAQM